MNDYFDPLDSVTTVSYELAVVRTARDLDERALDRHALPNLRVELVKEASRQLTTFFTDLIVGKRYSSTKTSWVPYKHTETVTFPFNGTVEAKPHLWWLTFAVLLVSSSYFAFTASGFIDLMFALQVFFGSVQLWRWRSMSTPFKGSVSREVTFEGSVQSECEEVWLIDPLLDEKYDFGSDRIVKAYVSPVPSTLP